MANWNIKRLINWSTLYIPSLLFVAKCCTPESELLNHLYLLATIGAVALVALLCRAILQDFLSGLVRPVQWYSDFTIGVDIGRRGKAFQVWLKANGLEISFHLASVLSSNYYLQTMKYEGHINDIGLFSDMQRMLKTKQTMSKEITAYPYNHFW